MNLVNNAVDAIVNAPEFKDEVKQSLPVEGEIVIETSCRDEEMTITAKDNGPGMSDEDLDIYLIRFSPEKK